MTTVPPEFTEREAQIIEYLSVRYDNRTIETRIVDVNKLEGGSAATLRFTLDGVSSTDLDRDRIAAADVPVEDFVTEVAQQLETPAARTPL